MSNFSEILKQIKRGIPKHIIEVEGDEIISVRRDINNFNTDIDPTFRIDTKNKKVFINGVDSTKKDGSKTFMPTHPSNLLIQEIKQDKRRITQ